MMRFPTLHARIAAPFAGLVLAAAQLTACSGDAGGPCSEGTVYDDRMEQCVSDGSLGRSEASETVASIDLGTATLTNVDVPDVLTAGEATAKTLTVRNNTQDNWGPFMIRFALAKQCPGKVGGFLEHAEKDFVGCTDTCSTAKNGTCDDGWPGPHDNDACKPGSDCTDCGVRGAEWACEYRELTDADPQSSCEGRRCTFRAGAACQCDIDCAEAGRGDCCSDYENICPDTPICQANEFCSLDEDTERAAGMCTPDLVSLTSAIVPALDAGASLEVEYVLSLPANWTDTDDYSFVILFDEEPLIVDPASGNIIHDPLVPTKTPAGMTPFHLASAVYVHPTTVQAKVNPPDIDASIKFASSMLELDDTMRQTRPALLANVSFSSLGQPVRSAVSVAFTLKLPGHKIANWANYDGGNPTATYDADRVYEMMIAGVYPADVITPDGETPAIPQGVAVDRTADPDAREGTTLDRSYALHLDRLDVRELSQTLKLRSQNPDLNGSDEIAGTLVMEVKTVYAGRVIKEIFEKSVVFKAPSIVFSDSPTNNTPRTAAYSDPPPSLESQDPFAAQPEGPYPEIDNITPTWHRKYGGSWLGAEAQVRNFTSKGSYNDAVVRQEFLADNYLRVYLFKFPNPFYLLRIHGHVDYGTMRSDLKDNKGVVEVRVPATSIQGLVQGIFDESQYCEKRDLGNGVEVEYCGVDPAGGLTNAGALTNTLIDADLQNTTCTTTDGVQFCEISLTDPSPPPNYHETQPAPADPKKKDPSFKVNNDPGQVSVEYTREREKRMCKPIPQIGPYCLVGKLSATFSIGIKGSVGFFLDPPEDVVNRPEYFSGIQVSVGPFAKVSADASGELSLLIIGATLAGHIDFVETALTPTLRLGLAQELMHPTGKEPCWRRNTGRVQFTGPASLTVMKGNVGLQVWVGPVISIPFIGTLDLRVKVLDFTLFRFGPAAEYSWELWNETVDFRGEGICEGLDSLAFRWSTPTGCTTVTGEDSYCPNSNGSDGKYKHRIYTGPDQCGTIIIDGALEPYGFDSRANASIGDYIEVVTGPIGDRAGGGEAVTIVSRGADCAAYSTDFRLFDANRGSVVCGQYGATNPRPRIYSGEFNNFKLQFCKDPNADSEYYRWIDVALRTDGALSTKGVAVRFEPNRGPETTVHSEAGWESSTIVQNSGKPQELNFKLGEYPPAQKVKDFFAAPSPPGLTIQAPFNSGADAPATSWIWPRHIGNSPSPTPQGGHTYNNNFARFRRPFVATSDAYTVRVYCPPEAICRAAVNGKWLVANAGRQPPIDFAYNSSGRFYFDQGTGAERTVETRRGEAHLLYVEARFPNEVSPSFKGIAVMMKPVQ